MDRNIDNCIEWIEGDLDASYTFTSRSAKFKNKIIKLKQKYPLRVTAIVNDDGSMSGKIPLSWIKIFPPRVMNLTEAQKAELSQRMNNGRNNG